MIDKILDNLYISDATSVISDHGKQKIKELGISYILTTSAMAIPDSSKISHIQYKFIFIMDMMSQDILGNNLLENALEYIETAINLNEKVLVHCEVGVSRSVAIVAAYLMRQFKWSPSKAILFIQNSRPIANPNVSFIRQLAVFHNLGYKADRDTLLGLEYYRIFCADSGNIPHGDSSSTLVFNDHASNTDSFLTDTTSTKFSRKRYRCRHCRHDLFYDIHILHHSVGDEEVVENLDDEEKVCKYEYLITPMKWMKLDAYQGKILCPKCGDKLGQYIWGGRQCLGDDVVKCGRHISPWVHIQKIKVDVSPLAGKLAHLPTVQLPHKESVVTKQ